MIGLENMVWGLLVMQMLQVFYAHVLPLYDIRSMACVLFQPVEYDIFESKWTQLVDTAVAQHAVVDPQDPRHGIGADVLLGTGTFADLGRQIAYDSLVLKLCQRTGMAALIQAIERSAPKQSFTMVVQGANKSFL